MGSLDSGLQSPQQPPEEEVVTSTAHETRVKPLFRCRPYLFFSYRKLYFCYLSFPRLDQFGHHFWLPVPVKAMLHYGGTLSTNTVSDNDHLPPDICVNSNRVCSQP